MKRKKQILWYSVLLLAFCLSACQVKRPDTVLSDAKMEDVLYDFHIAKAIGEDIPYNESYKRVLYLESVYKKHDITKADFDSSMVWFARYPENLTKIYEKINTRLKAERDGINHLIAIRYNKPKESLPGDSVNVWIENPIYHLTGKPLNNKLAFILPSDSNFKDRDTLKWTVRFHFLNGEPDKMSAPSMAMQLLYAKDTITNFIKINKSGVRTLTMAADTLGEIKEVRGFIYYPAQKSAQSLLADRIKLMRYHAKDTLFNASKDSVAKPEPAKTDTLIKKTEEMKKLEEEQAPRHETRPRPRLRQATE